MSRFELDRRKFLALGGVGAAGAAAAACAREDSRDSGSGGAGGIDGVNHEELIVDFAGAHQAGIITPMQNNLHFAAFDMSEKADQKKLIRLLERWTAAARPCLHWPWHCWQASAC